MSAFLMAGGGTGGHVIPLLAVARELRGRGHDAVFVGTRKGFEAKLVPPSGFPIEWIEIGALQGVEPWRKMRTLVQLPWSVLRSLAILRRHRARAVFSMGGYVAGPVVLAAMLSRLPVVVMEPNAMPGLTNRRLGRFVARALIGFPEAAAYFPKGKTEITGLPVRPEFFAVPPRHPPEEIRVLITGGSRGARTLNRAARESWPMFREAGLRVQFFHQAGAEAHAELVREFSASGLEGTVVPFIDDMAAAFSAADVVVCRAGAGTVAELAAAGKASVLVPFPFAAEDHQFHNAKAYQRAGAARLVPDRELDGRRLFEEVSALARQPAEIEAMAHRVRQFAHPGAARRAAELLEEFTGAH